MLFLYSLVINKKEEDEKLSAGGMPKPIEYECRDENEDMLLLVDGVCESYKMMLCEYNECPICTFSYGFELTNIYIAYITSYEMH